MGLETPAARRWSAILDEYEASGLSLREFAEQRGLNRNTLAGWRWRLGRSQGRGRPVQKRAKPVFAEVELVGDVLADPRREASPGGGVRLRLRGGAVELAVERDTDLELLRRVVEALC